MPLCRRPRRTIYSRAEVPLGTVRERDAGNGQLVRMIKIRMDGEPGRRWIPFARWWWEQHRGAVPRGKRVCHKDGVLLNDDPGNLVLLTPGEVFNLYHRLNPEMSRSNRAACGRSAAKRNVETGRRRRATQWLPCQWYGVDFAARVVHNLPRRKRWMVYRDHGLFERLGEQLKLDISQAKDGDTSAAAAVLRQARAIPEFWRWIRSAALGWPGINCMQACILAALADGGRPMATGELRVTVRQMREAFAWRPFNLERGVLASMVSSMRDWVSGPRIGGGVWSILPAAVRARLDGPRIVAVRGRDLVDSRFSGFERE